jgi:hypothetical protein
MADPVKISELPAISSVQANDIIPIVDAALTQTSKATAAQIAAIGGGPPGDGTVTEGKIAAGAVTAGKVGFTGPDKLLSRTLTGAGAGTEIPCTPYARGLLAVSTAGDARTYLNALQSSDSPTFTGTVTVSGDLSVSGGISGQVRSVDGTAGSPAYSFSGDTNTGIARLGGADTLSLVTGGVERMRVTATGAMQSVAAGGSTLLPMLACRAWVLAESNFIHASQNVSSISRSQAGVYGVNFTTPMPSAAYCVTGSTNQQADYLFRFGTLATHSFTCSTYTFTSLEFVDAYRWTTAVFL